MQVFFCKLVPSRANFVQDISPAELTVMQQHGLYWKGLIDQGVHVFALGLVMDPAGAFGVAIVEVDDVSAMQALTTSDPAVKAGIGMRYEIHPMPRGVMHA